MATDEKVVMMDFEENDQSEKEQKQKLLEVKEENFKSRIIHEYSNQRELPHAVNIGEVFDKVTYCSARDACYGRLNQKRHAPVSLHSHRQNFEKRVRTQYPTTIRRQPPNNHQHHHHHRHGDYSYFSKALF